MTMTTQKIFIYGVPGAGKTSLSVALKHKLEQEIGRYNKFQYGVLGLKKEIKSKMDGVDVKTYAKYILKEGSVIEKRELMGCLKSKFIMKDHTIILEK